MLFHVVARVSRWGSMFLLLAVWGGAADVPPASVVSPRSVRGVVLDGRLDEPGWRLAGRLDALLALGSGAAVLQEHTEVRLMHDTQALYIGIRCQGLYPEPLPVLPRDDRRIYQHDRIEIFLDPTPEDEVYVQLVIDAGGNIRDSRIEAGVPNSGAVAWNGAWEAAVFRTADSWSLEAVIPYAALDAAAAMPASLWRLKVCRDGGREGPLCWPLNTTGSFHHRDADGSLYFERFNLLENADFEQGVIKPDGVPPGWHATLTSAEVEHAIQGTVETVAAAGATGTSRVLRLTKLASALWWPQIWSAEYHLSPRAVYEFSVLAKGTLPQVNLRANCSVHGQTVKLSRTFDLPGEWTRLRYVFCTPDGVGVTRLGLSVPRGISGEVYYDQAVLRRSLLSGDAADRAVPLTHAADPDPVQGLLAFMERQGQKPYELFERDNELLTQRLIFRDRRFGTQVWLLDDSPASAHAGTASVWSAWNSNGSTIYVEGMRRLGSEWHRGWFFNSDFSRLRPAPGGRPAVWAPEDPDIYYGPIGPSTGVFRCNWRSGESEPLATWEPLTWPGSGQRLYGLTRDGRHLFVDLPNRGIFVPFAAAGAAPIPQVRLYDGRPLGPGGRPVGSNTLSVIYDHPEHGDLIALRTGMLVDRITGERHNIVAPLCGNTNYLRAFVEGRVTYPVGDEWAAYGLPWFAQQVRLPLGLDLAELHALWRNLPHVTHGHESPSPDWRYIASDGAPTLITQVRDGISRSLRLSPNGTNYHLNWGADPRFFVGWVRGWHFGSYLRPRNANIEFQVFFDGTCQPIVDTKHRLNGYYSGGDFAMFSPDATKIHYASSMTGRFRNYIAVMARPRPPRTPTWRREGGAVVLSWSPSAYSRETRGYLVYRGTVSGGPYELMTRTPVTQLSWRDTTATGEHACCYVLTALEHSGLESRYSVEAVGVDQGVPTGNDGPVTLFLEAEDAVRDLPTDALPGLSMGVDREAASDWYYLYGHPEADTGRAALPLKLPLAGSYYVWARIGSLSGEEITWMIDLPGQRLTVTTTDSAWIWVPAAQSPLELPAGDHELRLATDKTAARIDMLCLTTDPGRRPQGPRPENTTAPTPPRQLQVANLRDRVNSLTWAPSPDPRLAYYQVYAGHTPGFALQQEALIGSPSNSEFIDWGLRPGMVCHYAVTAVDRQGNESVPIRGLQQTPVRSQPPVQIELSFAEGDLTGPFEVSTAGGLRASHYVVAQEPQRNRVAWQVELPREGEYYFWLRHLLRGSGGRGEGVDQRVRVLANGREVTMLGGGRADLNVSDSLVAPDHPLAPRLWTWAWPGNGNLESVMLPAGPVDVVLENLAPDMRYDVLLLTDEPSFVPQDGRLRQR